MLQYSILQHYEVCKTPLLDVTQSLKAACSFAILDNKDNVGYIYVLGIPYMTGRISVDSEEYITNVRLLSIGCSLSKRPFFQEGYLVQTEFTTDSDIKKGELDFNRRLIAIYKFNNNEKFKFLTYKKIKTYGDLSDLFFGILAKRHEQRDPRLEEKFGYIPYLNSSLFEETELERDILKKAISIFSKGGR